MSKKILLIENDAAFASTLARALEARGLAVRVTGDGKEGLDLARDSRPDAVVLCVELPRMSGYSVCQKLRKDDELKGIPLVLTSAEATQETFEAHRKLKARADEYLIKPFAPAALVEKLSALVALPPPPAEGEELVTLDDVEELSGEIPLIPEGEIVRPQDALPEPDEDLKLLDDAFDSIAGDTPPARELTPGLGGPLADEAPLSPGELQGAAGLLPAEDESAPSVEIDRLGEEADRALDALGAEEPASAAPEPQRAAALLDTPAALQAPPLAPPAAAPYRSTPPPARTPAPYHTSPPPFPAPDYASLTAAAPPPRATPVPGFSPQLTAGAGAAAALTSALAEKDAEIQRLQDRVSELLIEVARAKDHLDRREAETMQLRGASEELEGRVRGLEADLASREAELRRQADEARQTMEREVAAAREEARREASARTETEEQLRRNEEALHQLQEAHRQSQETLHQAQEALQGASHHAQEAQRQAEAQRAQLSQALQQAEEQARRTGERAGHLEAEVASLRLKVEETEQTASLKAAQLADALAQRDALGQKATGLEGDLQTALALRGQLESLRSDLDASHVAHEGTRAEAERRAAELSKRISELEAVNAKHEERVVKAYQKIKSDEKIREKTRKALAIALQLLDERIAAAAPKDPSEPVPRRE